MKLNDSIIDLKIEIKKLKNICDHLSASIQEKNKQIAFNEQTINELLKNQSALKNIIRQKDKFIERYS